ncbi:MAG: polysaccharide biosynthesis/export family protein [Bacteroidota bacterium]
MQDSGIGVDTLLAYKNPFGVYHLQTDDVLSVSVKSLDQSNASQFNLQEDRAILNVSPGYTFLNGYSVDKDGRIHLPVIGSANVGGKTVPQVQNILQRKVDSLLNGATVLVNLVSFKVSVLGEVNAPGQFYVYHNRLTILEAIARAGDLLEFSNRTRVNLIRQTEQGSVATMVDLTDASLPLSPYFYLRPNDVIYVEPLRQKSARINLSNVQILTAVFTGISTVGTILLLFRN